MSVEGDGGERVVVERSGGGDGVAPPPRPLQPASLSLLLSLPTPLTTIATTTNATVMIHEVFIHALFVLMAHKIFSCSAFSIIHTTWNVMLL